MDKSINDWLNIVKKMDNFGIGNTELDKYNMDLKLRKKLYAIKHEER